MHSAPQNITHLSNFTRLLSLQCLSASPQHIKTELETFHGAKGSGKSIPTFCLLLPHTRSFAKPELSVATGRHLNMRGSAFCFWFVITARSFPHTSRVTKTTKKPAKAKLTFPLSTVGKNPISKTRHDREKLDHKRNKTHLK